MATRDQIIQEYNKYFPGRKVSDQDIANAESKGLGVIQASYNQITGQQSTNSPTATAGQQGAAAASPGSIEDVRGRRNQLLETKNDFLSLVQDALTKTQQVVAPFNEAQKDVRNKLTNLPKASSMKGLDPDAIMRTRANNIAYWQNELTYIQQQQKAAEQKIAAEKEFLLQGLNDQVAAYGYTLDDLLADRQYQLELAKFQASLQSGGGGGSGSASGDAMAWLQAIAEGRATLSQVPSAARESVISLMNQYGVNAPQEVGAYPTFDQWYAQKFSNMTPNQSLPELQGAYQTEVRELMKNNYWSPINGGFNGFNSVNQPTTYNYSPSVTE